MTHCSFSEKLGHDCGAWLLSALVVLSSLDPAKAQDYTVTTNGNTVTITRYTGPGGVVSIPALIGGVPVSGIGDSAFSFSYSLTSVAIPDGVTNLGQLVFLSCTSLTNVSVSASVIGIGQLSFKNCGQLAAITVDTNNPAFSAAGGVLFDKTGATLVQYPQGKAGATYAVPASVRTIGAGAFFGCAVLTNVSLPPALLDLETTAFYGCSNLAYVTLPAGVTNIGTQAFLSCVSLPAVAIPDSVTSLGSQAFINCSGLTRVTIGGGVTSIGDNTFSSCSSLTNVTLGSRVATIGNLAFDYCSALGSLVLDSSLTNISAGAFSYCFDLASVTIQNGLAAMGSQAFYYCSSLPTINLPASVTNLGDRVFEFCGGLTAITVDPDNPAYESINGVLFDKRQARLVQYPVNNTAGSYTIPDGVADIADTAFVSAYYLTSVTIPASLTNFETLAFYNCPEVTGFFFEGNAPGLGGYVFDLDHAATAYYLAGTTGWGQSYGGLPAVLWNPHILADGGAVKIQTNPFGFTIAGTMNIPVVIEASTNLVAGPWVALQTAVLTNGWFYFGDPQWTNYPGRYYRIRSP